MHNQIGETGLAPQAKGQRTAAVVQTDAEEIGHLDQLSIVGGGRKVKGEQGCQVRGPYYHLSILF